MTTVHVESGVALAHTISVRHHRQICDEGPEVGGTDSGPEPTELLLGALGACVGITLKMYAARKGWEIGRVEVDLAARDAPGLFVIERRLTFGAPLSDEQRTRLVDIAGKCPVSRRLTGAVEIRPMA